MQELTRGYGLIEGPLWLSESSDSKAVEADSPAGLLFSDVLGGGVFSLAADGLVKTVFEHRRGIGGMAWHQAGGVVVSGRNVSFKSFSGGATEVLLDRDEAGGNVGYNDLTTDSAGRIYVGSLGASPVFADGREPASGDLYLIDLDGSSRPVAQDIQLTNGLGFAPDGKTLYHSDSRRRTVYSYDVAANGDLGAKQVFVETASGAPDGLAVAVDGSVWVALAGGGGVAGYSAGGEFLQLLSIPEPMCTSVCFGGQELKTLFVTGGHLEEPGHGGVVRFPVEIPGMALRKTTI